MVLDTNELRARLGLVSGEFRHAVTRICAEIDFAQGLCQLHPDQAEAWSPLIAEALAVVEVALAGGELRALAPAVAAAERVLEPLAATAKGYVVRLVGHAHIDMNWMWSWPETVAVTNDSFSTVLKLMDEYPGFCFSQSQASVYALIAEHHPALLERIRQRVAEGRWEVTASHWVEGDKNLASGESLCRHLLYTRRYLADLFGLKPEDVPVDWSPDTFGHAATIPVYLARGGVKYYYGHRFGIVGARRPVVFWWEGPDGSRVLVRNDSAHGYNGSIDEGLGARLLAYVKDSGVADYMFVYGVGDHGGGPTRRDLERAIDLATWPIYPTVRFSSAEAYFEKLATYGERLPTWTGELNYEFTGCYTTQTVIKRANRLAENQLVAAEVAAALGWAAAGREYPAGRLAEAWRDTLFSHFHDILPGSGVFDTRTYCHGLFQKTTATTSMVETLALRDLAARVDTSRVPSPPAVEVPPMVLASGLGAGVGFGAGEGAIAAAEQSSGTGNRPFVIFNPTAHARREVVVATVWDNGGDPPDRLAAAPWRVVAPDGAELPAQRVEAGHYWGHNFARFAFPVRDVAGFGYGLYTLAQGASSAAPAGPAVILGGAQCCSYAPPERCDLGLENELLRIEIEPASGGLARLQHKASGLELVDPARPAAVLEYAVERPHGMTAWSLNDTGPVSCLEVVSIDKRAEGPYLAAIEVRLRHGENAFSVRYELRAGDPSLYVGVSGTWLERGTPERGVPVLRLALPLALDQARGRYEVPFGAVDRDLCHGEEVPALQWAQVSGLAGSQPAGCVVANDCKYGHSLDGSTLRVTVVRSSHDPDPLPEIGQQGVRLALTPFAGELPVADAVRAGQAFNNALRVVGTDVHAGSLPPAAALLTVAGEGLVVGGLKKAEDAAALIVRLFETTGQPQSATITPDPQLLGRVAEAVEVDLMERPLPACSAAVEDGAATVRVPAYGLSTVRVTLDGP